VNRISQDEDMSQLNCPHCGKEGISIRRKLTLLFDTDGERAEVACSVCGEKLILEPLSAFLATIPIFVALIVAILVEPFGLQAIIMLIGVLITLILEVFHVRLDTRKY
jgi:predicted RNA-binding Zn-ribbon protein involved in translation (DUF1610 family)